MRDLKNNIDALNSLAPAGNRLAAVNGTGVNLQGFEGAVVVFSVGVITDGVHTPKVQESIDDVTYTDVAAADLEGAFANLASNVNQRIGYKGIQKYIRAVCTSSGVTGGMYAAVVVRGRAHLKPVA